MGKIPSELITGYLNNSLTPSETEDFHLWINACAENKKIFFDAKAIYDAKASAFVNFSFEDSWKRLLHKKYAYRRKRALKTMSKYAAVVTITMICTSLLFIFQNKTEPGAITQYIGGTGVESDKLILPDGTGVNIAANTVLEFSDSYGKKDRVVYLHGEAFFDVAKIDGKPFKVMVDEQQIEALGTKFNVMAYKADSIMATTLLEGSVRLTGNGVGQPTVLRPNQQAVYNKNTQTVEVRDVEASLYTCWTEGYYYFCEQSLNDILHTMSRLYNITYEINSGELKNRKFTGAFYRGQSIREVLEIVNISIPIKYEIKDNHLIIGR